VIFICIIYSDFGQFLVFFGIPGSKLEVFIPDEAALLWTALEDEVDLFQKTLYLLQVLPD